MSDFAAARANMVEAQVRTNDVTDRRIINAMAELPREAFVPASMCSLAYMDQEIELRSATADMSARRLLAPMPLAKLIQLAEIRPDDLVLDVGCMTGYSTAILSRLADSVVGLESNEELAEQAARTLRDLGVDNAAVVTAPLKEGYPSEGPYDVILLNGCVPEVPSGLFDQLKEGARLVGVISQTGIGKANLCKKVHGDVSCRPAFDAGVSSLPGFELKPEFVF